MCFKEGKGRLRGGKGVIHVCIVSMVNGVSCSHGEKMEYCSEIDKGELGELNTTLSL